MTDFYLQVIEDAGASVLFGCIVLMIFAAFMVLLMFVGLAVRGAWRWLMRSTWNDVIVSAERKALH